MNRHRERLPVAQAEASLRSEAPVRRRGKACRNLVLRRALGVAAELGRPFQLHTGFGDSEIRLGESHPLLLEELLRSPEGSSATIVLIHGAFPWHEEVAYLATVRPNVHVDVSLSNLFAPATLADRLLRIVELAPATKVVMGTDGHGAPETLWFGARMLRSAWQRAREAMADLAGDDWLRETEESIFEANARRLYRI